MQEGRGDVRILHGVDAKKVHKNAELVKILKEMETGEAENANMIDKVIFNFPCVPSKSGGAKQDAQLDELNENKLMLKKLFKSLDKLNKKHGIQVNELHIAHKTKGSFR